MRCAMGKVLHQQEIDLVFVRFGLLFLLQMAGNQVAQILLILQACALQQLPQLPDLHMTINLLKPLQHTFASFRLRAVRRVLKLRTGSYIKLKGVVQFDVDGVQPPRNAPEFGNLIQIERSCCCCHYFLSRLRDKTAKDPTLTKLFFCSCCRPLGVRGLAACLSFSESLTRQKPPKIPPLTNWLSSPAFNPSAS